jgi:transcription termination/antitermination protein NusA
MAEQTDLIGAIRLVCDEKNISIDSVINTIEAALAAAFRKDFGEKNQNIVVEFDAESGASKVYDVKAVVKDVDLEELEKRLEEQKEKREAGEEISEEEEIQRFNPKTEIMLTDAKKIKKGSKLEDEIRTRLTVPDNYGRMAAQTAKQVIIQRLREAERENIFNEYKDRQGELVNAVVQRVEGHTVLFDIGQATAVMPPEEQVKRERYESGRRLKVLISSVEMTSRGPQIVISRSSENFVIKLFEHEVPEVNSGMVTIKAVAREPGERTKVAVYTEEDNIDPVGSCVGQRGTRVQTIIQELGGEKIDIIEWEENQAALIENSISPAKVINVEINKKNKSAVVKVREDQLSLAIGKGGQNVRLASKLVGMRIDIAKEDGTVESDDVDEKSAGKDEQSSEPTEDGALSIDKNQAGEGNSKDKDVSEKKKKSAKKAEEKDEVKENETKSDNGSAGKDKEKSNG